MNTYRVTRGPVSPPASMYGSRQTLQTGDELRSGENPWIRACLRDKRLERLPANKRVKRTKKGDSDGR